MKPRRGEVELLDLPGQVPERAAPRVVARGGGGDSGGSRDRMYNGVQSGGGLSPSVSSLPSLPSSPDGGRGVDVDAVDEGAGRRGSAASVWKQAKVTVSATDEDELRQLAQDGSPGQFDFLHSPAVSPVPSGDDEDDDEDDERGHSAVHSARGFKLRSAKKKHKKKHKNRRGRVEGVLGMWREMWEDTRRTGNFFRKEEAEARFSPTGTKPNEMFSRQLTFTGRTMPTASALGYSTNSLRYRCTRGLFRLVRSVTSIYDPRGEFRMIWNVIFVLMLLYIMMAVPFLVCFDVTIDLWSPLDVWNLCVDCFFLTDVVVNFRTGYYDGTRLVRDPKKIARRYVRSWFLLDLLTSIPVDNILAWTLGEGELGAGALTQLPKAIRIFRYARAFKLVRMVKLMHVMSSWDDDPTALALIMRGLRTVIVGVFVVHLFACFWMGIAMLERPSDRESALEFGETQWPMRVPLFEDGDFTRDRLYQLTVYWSVMTISTVGFGDLAPGTQGEIMVATIAMALGALIFGYIVGTISQLVISFADEQLEEDRKRRRDLRSYMIHRKLPTWLQRSVMQHHEFVSQETGVLSDEKFLEELPDYLADKVIHHLYGRLMRNVPFLSQLGKHVQRQLVVKLKPVHVSAGEYIYEKGALGTEMYIIEDGHVAVILRKDDHQTVQAELGPGAYFGEYALFARKDRNLRRTWARALEPGAHILALRREDFHEILKSFPRVLKVVLKQVRSEWNKIQEQISPQWATDSVKREIKAMSSFYEHKEKIEDVHQRVQRRNSIMAMKQFGGAPIAEVPSDVESNIFSPGSSQHSPDAVLLRDDPTAHSSSAGNVLQAEALKIASEEQPTRSSNSSMSDAVPRNRRRQTLPVPMRTMTTDSKQSNSSGGSLPDHVPASVPGSEGANVSPPQLSRSHSWHPRRERKHRRRKRRQRRRTLRHSLRRAASTVSPRKAESKAESKTESKAPSASSVSGPALRPSQRERADSASSKGGRRSMSISVNAARVLPTTGRLAASSAYRGRSQSLPMDPIADPEAWELEDLAESSDSSYAEFTDEEVHERIDDLEERLESLQEMLMKVHDAVVARE